MNMKISYLYRDASNYKQYESVVVAAPEDITPAHIEATLRDRFAADQLWPDVLHFRPEDLGWPTAYFEDDDADDDDLDLHELESVELTDEPASTDFSLELESSVS